MASKIIDYLNNTLGDTFVLEDEVKDNDVVQDISSDTGTLTIKAALTDADPGFAQVSGTFVTDGTDGIIRFTIPKATTATASTSTLYFYDAQIDLAGGNKHTLQKGRIKWNSQVTES